MRAWFGSLAVAVVLFVAQAAAGQAPPPPPPPLKPAPKAAPPAETAPPEQKAPEKEAPPPPQEAPPPPQEAPPPPQEAPPAPQAPPPPADAAPPTPPVDDGAATAATDDQASDDQASDETAAETGTKAARPEDKAARRKALTAGPDAKEDKALTPEEAAAAERRAKAREAERRRQGSGPAGLNAPTIAEDVKVKPENFTLPVIAGLGTGAALSAAALAAGSAGLLGVYFAATPTGAVYSWLPVTLMTLGLGGGFLLGPIGAVITAVVAAMLANSQQGEDAARKTAYGALAGVCMAFGGVCGAPALAAFLALGGTVVGVFLAELTYFWLGAACGVGLCGLGMSAAGPLMTGVGAMGANLSYTEAVSPPGAEDKKPRRERRRRRPRRRPVSMAF